MNYFDEANKLADLVLQWWKEHKDDVDEENIYYNIYHEVPEFVTLALKIKGL